MPPANPKKIGASVCRSLVQVLGGKHVMTRHADAVVLHRPARDWSVLGMLIKVTVLAQMDRSNRPRDGLTLAADAGCGCYTESTQYTGRNPLTCLWASRPAGRGVLSFNGSRLRAQKGPTPRNCRTWVGFALLQSGPNLTCGDAVPRGRPEQAGPAWPVQAPASARIPV